MTFAFIFSDVGFGEWFVLLAVILVVVGPKRLPETARKFGSWYGKFRRAADSFKRQLMDMDREFERTIQEAERTAADALSVEEAPADATTPAADIAAAAADNETPDTNDGTHKES